jgi:hypothetical protein
MHVLQWIAVKDVSAEDAFYTVRDNLESYLNEGGGAWYDWFVAGGGRWNSNADNYNEDQSMTISANEVGHSVFIAKISECMENRLQEFKNYRKQFEERDVDINAKLDSYTGDIDFSFDLYPLSKMIDLMQGNWDFNSYFFDMEHHSTQTKYVLESLDKGENYWYLIPVDFHF